MKNLDIAVTRLINGMSGHSLVLDTLMIWMSAAGIPLLVALVALQ
ncbi:hypothetical protein [Pseudogemmobacter sp. W21_MBD1_M6]